MQDFGLYMIITQPQLSYAEIAGIAVRNEVRFLQLREKHLSDADLLAVARQLRSITAGTSTRLVINDRPDIALLCQADCLHLGQDEIAISDARRIVGDMPIGLSTHSPAQARQALQHNPLYIGFGPIHPTTTKANPDPTVGTGHLAQVVAMAEQQQVPVVAIGGIFPQQVPAILDAGARNLCLVRHLMNTTETEKRVKEITTLLQARKK